MSNNELQINKYNIKYWAKLQELFVQHGSFMNCLCLAGVIKGADVRSLYLSVKESNNEEYKRRFIELMDEIMEKSKLNENKDNQTQTNIRFENYITPNSKNPAESNSSKSNNGGKDDFGA